MQRLPVRIILPDEGLVLRRPVRPHDLLIRAVPDLHNAAILWSGSHVAEYGTAHGTPYHVAFISFQYKFVPAKEDAFTPLP
jgi:hypothetical protein